MISASFTLKADTDFSRYVIKCSTGTNIPVDTEGNPTADVTFTLYRQDENGLTATPAEWSIYYYDESGKEVGVHESSGLLPTFDYATTPNAVNIKVVAFYTEYDDKGTASIKSYAEEYYPIQYPADVEIIDILMSPSNSIQCDSDGNIQVNYKLSAYIGEDYVRGTWVLQYKDQNDVLVSEDSRPNPTAVCTITYSSVNGFTVAPSKLQVKFTSENGSVVTKDFSFNYANPIPFPRPETTWSADLTFRNGEMIILLGVVYMWSYPKAGNSTLSPPFDVTLNSTTTKWVAYQSWPLLCTSMMFAQFAKMGSFVFNGNYMFSQQGVDVNGNTTEDYREQGTDNFTPNFQVDGVSGGVKMLQAEIRGSLSQPFISLQLSEDEFVDQNYQGPREGVKYDSLMFNSNNGNGSEDSVYSTFNVAIRRWFTGTKDDIGRLVTIAHFPQTSETGTTYPLYLYAEETGGYSKYNFFEYGMHLNSITIHNEMVTLRGIGYRGNFAGWAVVSRIGMPNKSKQGKELKVLANGSAQTSSTSGTLLAFDGTYMRYSSSQYSSYRQVDITLAGAITNMFGLYSIQVTPIGDGIARITSHTSNSLTIKTDSNVSTVNILITTNLSND